MVILVNQEGLNGPQLVRNYLDLTPRGRIELLSDLAQANKDQDRSNQLGELLAKAQANPNAQASVVPYQINYDQKILPKIQFVTQDAIAQLIEFIKIVIELNKGEIVLDPISDKDVEKILSSEDSNENKVRKILERIGGLKFWDSTVFDEESFLLTSIRKKLFAPNFLINLQSAQPNTKMDLLTIGNQHMQLNCYGSELAPLMEDDTQLLNGNFNGTNVRSGEFYENLFNYKDEDKEVAELLPSQIDMIYQIIYNFSKNSNQSFIDLKQNPSLAQIQETLEQRNFPKTNKKRVIPQDSLEFPSQKLPLGLSSIALILNRLRKANLAYVYGDTRFFLK